MKKFLTQLAQGLSLTKEQAIQAFDQIMAGQADPAQVGALLGMLQVKGPAVSEIAGAATAMRQKVTPVYVPDGLTAIDTCGTGGDHANTFNVSTAAAIVAAGAARPHQVAVAKHGNRSITSQSGSSQVLESLGVKLHVQSETLTKCLDQAGICFCFAPAHHPAMKHAMPIRQALGFRTLFNILGPLTNPANVKRQVIGVFALTLTKQLAQVLAELGSKHVMIVHGQDDQQRGLDEIITWGKTQISELKDGQIKNSQVTPEQFNLPRAALESVQVNSVQQSAKVISDILDGQKGSPRDLVCINAAAALIVADVANDFEQGLKLAYQSIDRGEAKRSFEKLIAITQADRSS